jgi:hypothetical protein
MQAGSQVIDNIEVQQLHSYIVSFHNQLHISNQIILYLAANIAVSGTSNNIIELSYLAN